MTHNRSPRQRVRPPAPPPRRICAYERGWLRPLARPLARAWSALRGERAASVVALVEEYEPRLMYSVDLAPHARLLASSTQPVEQRVMDAQGDYVATQVAGVAQRVELVIVDAAVIDEKNSFKSNRYIKFSRDRNHYAGCID